MGGPAHDPAALAEFQNGEMRLVYARHREAPEAPAYYLEDGTARAVRAWAKEHLECFMPDCSDRRLTTVARTGKRDGFSHYRGSGGHSREGLFHQQAKALIARWAAETAQGTTAAVEQATEDGSRIADVMVTWPDGSRVAVEVQYAAETVEHWRDRDQGYRRQGITPVWLLGHLPPHLRAEPGLSSRAAVSLGVLHQAIVQAGMDVLWINPINEKIATTWVVANAHRCPHFGCRCPAPDLHDVRPGECSDWGYFAADPLAECRLTPAGLETPTTRRLAESMAALEQARAREQERLNRRSGAAAQRRSDERAAWIQQKKQEHEDRWLDSELRGKVLARYGRVPPLLSVELRDSYGVFAHPEHWHTALYGDLILAKPAGTHFGLADCYRTLRDNHHIDVHGDVSKRCRAVSRFLDHLVDHGLLRKHLRPESRKVDYYEVVYDLERYWDSLEEADARRAESERRVREEERRRRERAQQARARAEELRQERLRRTSASPVVEGNTHTAKCISCGQALDPILARRGRHILC